MDTAFQQPAVSVHYAKTVKCRVCGNSSLIPILDLGEQALTGRFPRQGEPDPPVAPLQLLICDTGAASDACGLVQMAHTCDLEQMYGASYGYRSSITKTMVNHLHATGNRMMSMAGLKPGDWVLEIGSNDGTMQHHLAGRGFNLVAIDPSAAKFAENYPKDSRLVVDFFSKKAVETVNQGNTFRAILSIAMFYDLDNPFAFMTEAKQLLAKDGVWCFEQSYLPALYRSLCYDTICHEHLCYYSLTQIEWMAKRCGLRLLDVDMNDINGGSFVVFVCHDDAPHVSKSARLAHVLAAEKRMNLGAVEKWHEFARNVRFHRARIRGFLEDARAAGDLVLGLGASTKGNVMLQYAGIDTTLMPAIGERDLRKVGMRAPRTNIPIISEDDARAMKPRNFVVFPWHFRDEIISRERAFLDGGGRLVFPLPRFEVVTAASVRNQETTPRQIAWAAPMLFGDERSAIAEALDSTMISGGAFVEQAESLFSVMHENTAAITTNNGTTALQLAYLALGIGPGDEVIVPGWGFMAAANMALAIGAVPVYADIDPDTWLLDPKAAKAKIGPKTKAIVAIHTYGNVCDTAALAKIAKDAGIFLIEDCAESLGSKRDGRICGIAGDVGTFSFQATKLITCGEGGMITVRAPEVAERARLIRSHAMKGKRRYWHHDVGHNMRLSNIHAAMLCAQHRHWPELLAARIHLRHGYEWRLAGVKGIRTQRFESAVDPVVWAPAIQLEGADEGLRDRMIGLMDEAGIECRPGFYTPAAQPIYKAAQLPHSEVVASSVIIPPIDAGLGEEALDHICDTFIRVWETARTGR